MAAAGYQDWALEAAARARLDQGRTRFVGIQAIVEPDNRIRARVTLEWGGKEYVGDAVGEKGDAIELRTAASAALNALECVIGQPLGIRLVGVKHVRAFDAEPAAPGVAQKMNRSKAKRLAHRLHLLDIAADGP